MSGEEPLDLFASSGEVHTLAGHCLGRNAVTLPEDSKEKVLGAHVIIAQRMGLFGGQSQGAFPAGRNPDVTRGDLSVLLGQLSDEITA